MQDRMPPRIALRAVVGGAVAMLAAALGVASAVAGDPPGAALVPAPAIRYGRDIRPLLSDRCFLCHGPDRAKQKAGLRLDSFEDATAARKDGAAIVPGKPDESILLRRVTATAADTVMPPPDSGKHAVTAAEAALLRQWIAEGAHYEKHWAFVPPVRALPPAVKDAAWPRNELDRFVLANLERQGAHPSAEADRATLCRRIFLDLTGLPPTPEESTAYSSRYSASIAPPSSLVTCARLKPLAIFWSTVASGIRSPASCSTMKRSYGLLSRNALITQSRHSHIWRPASMWMPLVSA